MSEWQEVETLELHDPNVVIRSRSSDHLSWIDRDYDGGVDDYWVEGSGIYRWAQAILRAAGAGDLQEKYRVDGKFWMDLKRVGIGVKRLGPADLSNDEYGEMDGDAIERVFVWLDDKKDSIGIRIVVLDELDGKPWLRIYDSIYKGSYTIHWPCVTNETGDLDDHAKMLMDQYGAVIDDE